MLGESEVIWSHALVEEGADLAVLEDACKPDKSYASEKRAEDLTRVRVRSRGEVEV